MIDVLVWFGTFVGWAMIGHVATRRVLSWRKRRRPDPAQARLERIARLEIECGIGVKYAEEALANLTVKYADSFEKRYAAQGIYGYTAKRRCWACDRVFNGTQSRDPLAKSLCGTCLTKARAELDYGVPL